MAGIFSKRAQFKVFGGEEKGISEELKAEEEKRKKQELASLQNEALTINEKLGHFRSVAAGLVKREAIAPEEAPMITKQEMEIKSEINALEKKLKSINREIKKAGGQPVGGLTGFGGGFGFSAISGSLIGKILLVVFVIFLVIGVFWYFAFTTTGSYLSTEAGSYSADIKNALRETGMYKQFNIMSAIFLGEYDPTELWDSKVYRDRYAVVDDVGVEIEDLRASKEFFLYSEPPEGLDDPDELAEYEVELSVTGKIKIASFPDDEDGITVDISAKDKLGNPWKCAPNNIYKQQRYIGRIECTYELSEFEAENTKDAFSFITVTVNADYNFGVKAGKQIYITTQDELSRLYIQDKEPLSHFEITKDAVQSWQTKSPVSLSMGFPGDEDIIAANDDNDPKPENTAPYYLGFNIKNDGTGKIKPGSIITITLELPAEIECIDSKSNDFGCKLISTNPEFNTVTYDYTIVSNVWENIGAGTPEVFYFVFKADKDKVLKGSVLSSFFVLAEADYEYIDTESVAVKLKKMD